MDTKEGHDRPHLLDAQLIHWPVRLPPLAVLVLARVSELRTESSSVLFLASADPDRRRGELGGGEVSRARGGMLVGLMTPPTTGWVD